ncbi:MAG TPA: HemK2/MTQ2 family protein methyltransferase [Methylomirabilota bacterium]|jgi:release factor glutamine methyltransferase|nr:HemK2/MTQ2 family protein methyltransferase [Methylomirabilota bacterium]
MAEAGTLLFVYEGCVFRVAEGAQAPSAGTLFLLRHLDVADGEAVLDIGTGAGFLAVLAARRAKRVVATDVVPEAVALATQNAALNGVTERVDVRLGDGYDPVAGESFDLIITGAPQMPTPPGPERDDWMARADNGGPDGWAVLDQVIAGAPAHLRPGGRLRFSLFAFLGERKGLGRLEAAGLAARVVARETQPFPRLGYERLQHIRTQDVEGTLPRGVPRTVERLLLEGRRA